MSLYGEVCTTHSASTQATDGLDTGPSTCRYSTSPSISKTRRARPSRAHTTENDDPAARTLLQAETITPMMTESKKLTRLRSTRTAGARSKEGWASCSRSSSALDKSNSPESVTTATPSATHTLRTKSACSKELSCQGAMRCLLPGIGRVRKATQGLEITWNKRSCRDGNRWLVMMQWVLEHSFRAENQTAREVAAAGARPWSNPCPFQTSGASRRRPIRVSEMPDGFGRGARNPVLVER